MKQFKLNMLILHLRERGREREREIKSRETTAVLLNVQRKIDKGMHLDAFD